MEKRQSQTIISTIVIAVAALGMLGGYAISNVSFESQINTMQNNAFMTGHVALTLKDADGNIKDYRQTDNLIVTTGENCASKLLFSAGIATTQNDGDITTPGNSTVACAGAITAPFTVIAIGNNTAAFDATANVYCTGAVQSSGLPVGVGGGNTQLGCEHDAIAGFERARDGAPAFTNATQSSTPTAAKVIIDKTFTNNQGSAQTVSESGVFNNTGSSNTTSAMFARQTFSTITVSNGDSLTVEWTINVGSATALDSGNP